MDILARQFCVFVKPVSLKMLNNPKYAYSPNRETATLALIYCYQYGRTIANSRYYEAKLL